MSAARKMLQQALYFLLVTLGYFVSAEIIHGSVTLNSGAFDKVIEKHKAVLVKFDEMFAFGKKQDAFKEVAKASIPQPELLVAEIFLSEHVEKDNKDIATRYKITKDLYPAYRLFLNGDTSAPVTFSGNAESADAIKNFVTQKSGLWLGLSGCVEEFDKLVEEFLDSTKDQRAAVLQKAEQAANRLTNEEDKASADVYIKTMRKVVEKGASFIKSEVSRVEKLRTGKITDKKKEELTNRLNILATFQSNVKDEL